MRSFGHRPNRGATFPQRWQVLSIRGSSDTHGGSDSRAEQAPVAVSFPRIQPAGGDSSRLR